MGHKTREVGRHKLQKYPITIRKATDTQGKKRRDYIEGMTSSAEINKEYTAIKKNINIKT